jgi:hypothetical protein
MGSVGDSYDNALMENFWSTLKNRTRVPDLVADPERGRQRDLHLHRHVVQHPPDPEGEGAAMRFRAPRDIRSLEFGRAYAHVVPRFLTSAAYQRLAGWHAS